MTPELPKRLDDFIAMATSPEVKRLAQILKEELVGGSSQGIGFNKKPTESKDE